MLGIKKKANYIEFGNKILEMSGCKGTYEIIGENHFHYELNKNGMVIGILCYDNGDLSFAPFKSFKDRGINNCYISFDLVPSFKDFTETLTKLGELVL
jgi:hypothetical protein